MTQTLHQFEDHCFVIEDTESSSCAFGDLKMVKTAMVNVFDIKPPEAESVLAWALDKDLPRPNLPGLAITRQASKVALVYDVQLNDRRIRFAAQEDIQDGIMSDETESESESSVSNSDTRP